MHKTCCDAKQHRGHGVPLSLVGIDDTCIRKDSESASASLSASLVSLERRSSSCKVVRAGILASLPLYQNGRGYWVLEKGSSSRLSQIRLLFASLYPVAK